MHKLTSKQKDKTFYKWVCGNFQGNFIGFDYSEYLKEFPSKPLPEVENLRFCRSGYHFVDRNNLLKWSNLNEKSKTNHTLRLYKVKPIGDVFLDNDKYIASSLIFTEYVGYLNKDVFLKIKFRNIIESIKEISKFIYDNTSYLNFTPISNYQFEGIHKLLFPIYVLIKSYSCHCNLGSNIMASNDSFSYEMEKIYENEYCNMIYKYKEYISVQLNGSTVPTEISNTITLMESLNAFKYIMKSLKYNNTNIINFMNKYSINKDDFTLKSTQVNPNVFNQSIVNEIKNTMKYK